MGDRKSCDTGFLPPELQNAAAASDFEAKSNSFSEILAGSEQVRRPPDQSCVHFLWTALSIEGTELSIESALFYRMAGFLGIHRKRNAFYRKRKFLESAEQI